MKPKLTTIQKEIRSLADPEKAKNLMRFFKTGKGHYGEGDIFLGLMVPEQRKIAIHYLELSLSDTMKLLHSKYHEERLIALLILISKFKKGTPEEKKKIFDLYLANAKYVNNWDLVDQSAPLISGVFLVSQKIALPILRKLARSADLWERRIAIISTFAFIRAERFNETFEIAEMLLADKHDLIHKAVGWMLREVGKRDPKKEEEFIKKFAGKMPRTMLRYAIERFPEEKRKHYLVSSKA